MGFEVARKGLRGGLEIPVYNEFGTTLGTVDVEPERPELRALRFSVRARDLEFSPATARDFAAALRRAADQADELAGRR